VWMSSARLNRNPGTTARRSLTGCDPGVRGGSAILPPSDEPRRPPLTRAYRPQTNGKIERFHRTMADGWAFKKFYNSETARRAALPAWLHEYNHHRPHTAIGRSAPITRLTNLSGQYT
jgi:hypothetical protein